MRETTHSLMKSYLNNRIQKLTIGNLILAIFMYLISIPQNFTSYAGETLIISASDTFNEVKIKILHRSDITKLSLTIEKTVCVKFLNYEHSVTTKFDVKIKGNEIKRVENYKFLGVIFDLILKCDNRNEYLTKPSNTQFLFSTNFLNLCKQDN